MWDEGDFQVLRSKSSRSPFIPRPHPLLAPLLKSPVKVWHFVIGTSAPFAWKLMAPLEVSEGVIEQQ
jgi:hypothetical protein